MRENIEKLKIMVKEMIDKEAIWTAKDLIEAIERLKNIEAREKMESQFGMMEAHCDKPKETLINDK